MSSDGATSINGGSSSGSMSNGGSGSFASARGRSGASRIGGSGSRDSYY